MEPSKEPYIILLDSAPSTMDAARDELLAGRTRFVPGLYALPCGVMAREQTAGRGQRGRTWFARPGECLCATYYFGHVLNSAQQAAEISFVAGLAVCSALHDLREEPQAAGLGLKWPNDILLNGKKVGGILIEMAHVHAQTSGMVTTLTAGKTGASTPALVALVGVGINLSIMDFPPELAPFATSIKREGGNFLLDVEDEKEAQALARHIAHSLSSCGRIWQSGGLGSILRSWRRYDQTPGRVFETMEGAEDGVPVRGVAEGVADDGALCLRAADGRLLNVRSASSLREIPG